MNHLLQPWADQDRAGPGEQGYKSTSEARSVPPCWGLTQTSPRTKEGGRQGCPLHFRPWTTQVNQGREPWFCAEDGSVARPAADSIMGQWPTYPPHQGLCEAAFSMVWDVGLQWRSTDSLLQEVSQQEAEELIPRPCHSQTRGQTLSSTCLGVSLSVKW